MTDGTYTTKDAVRAVAEARLESLRNYRWTWWNHWAQLAEVFLPRRYRWFIAPNTYARGQAINAQIVDETGVLAARTLGTGLLANLTSPTKPWFSLGLAGYEVAEDSDIAIWLADCTKRMLDVYSSSNLYTSLGTSYHDLAVFGSAALIQYEDPEEVVRFYTPCLGEFFFGLDNRLTVDTLAREYTYTIKETVDEFGLDNVSSATAQAYRDGGSQLDREIVICHIIQPNSTVYWKNQDWGLACPKMFKYCEVYWEKGAANVPSSVSTLRIKGFREKPFSGLRWDVTSNDAYGRSPGMDALPAVRQLQIEQRRKAEAIDKMVRPPMVGSVAMKNEPMDILPGGVTFVANPQAEGFKPAFTVEPRIGELMEDLKEVQSRVREIFFNQLFTGVMDMDKVQTATYIDAWRQEKLVMLGPVVERTETEGLDEIISRTFAIMSRRGMFADPPPQIAGMNLEIKYISILAEAQRAASTASIERVFAFAGSLAGAIPQILDKLDSDTAIDHYAELQNVPPDIVRAAKATAQIRAARDQAIAAQTAMATGSAMAQGAKTLSETDVGDGQNALQAMMA